MANKRSVPRLNMEVPDGWLEKLDLWRAQQGYPIPNRSESVRRIVEDRFAADLKGSENQYPYEERMTWLKSKS